MINIKLLVGGDLVHAKRAVSRVVDFIVNLLYIDEARLGQA
jgi:hypothetical protein